MNLRALLGNVCLWLCILLFLAGCVPIQAVPQPEATDMEGHEHTMDAAAELGTVDFPISCSSEAQEEFNQGVALLHSFFFPPAIKSFEKVIELDSTCAMPYWGIAMSRLGIPWSPTPADALAAGQEAVDAALALGGKTPREQAYIDAIAAFYQDYATQDHGTRARAYEAAMAQLVADFPDDLEAKVFYALALNITASPTDKTYANQTKAREILEPLMAEHPNHPGVVHYLIHTNDYPSLAAQGLEAAERYASIAPAAPHALHMPSHIFTRLGYWQESIETNRASAEVAQASLPVDAAPDTAVEQALHDKDYMMYAYLQLAQDGAAKDLVDEIGAVKQATGGFTAAYALAAMPARYVLERGAWDEAASLTLNPPDRAWERFPQAEAALVFARGLGAARRGDVAAANQELERLHELHDALVAANDAYWSGQVEIQTTEVAAWIALAEGKNDEARTLMQTAAAQEDLTEKHPVTPGPLKPAHELLGELLLALNEPAAALPEFEQSQQIEPNRFWGWYGAARAAELAGDSDTAKSNYRQLLTLVANADSERPEIEQAQTFLAE
ncbi:MAG: hypothetical protein R3C14_30330 [Caldilineaceae bacterium]